MNYFPITNSPDDLAQELNTCIILLQVLEHVHSGARVLIIEKIGMLKIFFFMNGAHKPGSF
jgi:hypothetical protein